MNGTNGRFLTISKANFIRFIHLNFVTGILYAFYHFIRTPRSVDMADRRMWAAETWLLFTLYSVFLYLFIIETDAKNGEDLLHELFNIRRYIEIDKPGKKIVKVFEYLSKHPDKYKFATHVGVFPLTGKLDRPGSTFQTREVFLHILIALTFETTATSGTSFEFRLIKPLGGLEIRGEFLLKKTGSGKNRLYLIIFSDKRDWVSYIGLGIVFISPVRWLIARQITSELEFIETLL